MNGATLNLLDLVWTLPMAHNNEERIRGGRWLGKKAIP
jgi:hypothetical protein